MFERTKIDNAACQQQMTVPVEVTLDDGQEVRGKFIVPASRSLFEVLNGPGAFIEFEPYGRDRSLLAKSALKAVRIVNVPHPSLDRAREIDTFDPYRILGIVRGASFDVVREAYIALAKSYHPDRYAGLELPAEVRSYLAGMAQRVNAAYSALEAVEHSKRSTMRRAQPIYTSPAMRSCAPERGQHIEGGSDQPSLGHGP